MEEDSCGGRLADPLPSASPMPSCTESVTKQASRNTGQTQSLSVGSALFPESTTAKKLHTSYCLLFFFLNWIVASISHQRYGKVMIRKCLFSQRLANRSITQARRWNCKQTCSFKTLWQLATRNKVKHVVSDSTSSQSPCALTVRGCWGSARRDEWDSGGWGRNHFYTATITATVITLLTLTQIQIEAPKNYAQARRRKWLTSVC